MHIILNVLFDDYSDRTEKKEFEQLTEIPKGDRKVKMYWSKDMQFANDLGRNKGQTSKIQGQARNQINSE